MKFHHSGAGPRAPTTTGRPEIRYGPIRVPSVVAGGRGERLVRAAWSNAAERTLLSPALARRVAGRLGPEACASSGILGAMCGRTVSVEIQMGACRRVEVTAIVARLPPGVPAVLGDDVAGRVARSISLRPGGAAIVCRDRPLSVRQAHRGGWDFTCGRR